MNIFYSHLKSVKTSCFCYLYFTTKSFDQIFINYSITSCKKC
ncbi:hypothetical protein YKV021 [Yokapox virus]|uniref:Uncharacterized protein n=1 Tax=Yokapox virus TaxID=1076255 RepID=G3EI99_9POXV|nr:hypothetical protein YKV021 [Yokapox virus]AEN03610.1 hypothetical protein YKV021 [Yokapox virus]